MQRGLASGGFKGRMTRNFIKGRQREQEDCPSDSGRQEACLPGKKETKSGVSPCKETGA